MEYRLPFLGFSREAPSACYETVDAHARTEELAVVMPTLDVISAVPGRRG